MRKKNLKEEIKKSIQKIENSNNILITTHINPDADGIGSGLALLNFIKRHFPEKEVLFLIEGSCPSYLNFLKNSFEIKNIKDLPSNIPYKKFDLAIIVDCSTLERIKNVRFFLKDSEILNIDHHLEESNFNYVLKDLKASSTTQLVYLLLKKFNKFIDVEVGEALYTGLIQDTGNFSWNINTKTFIFAKNLINLGVNGEKISNNLFYNNNYNKLKLISHALSTMEYIENKKLIYSFISQEQLQKINATNEDIEGIIEILKSLNKANISILIKEEKDLLKSGSIRSKNGSANKLAMLFNGGGHSKAAGFKSNKSVEEIIKIIIQNIKE